MSTITEIANRTIRGVKGKRTEITDEEGTTQDIVQEIVDIDKLSQADTKEFAKHLKGRNLKDTCRNIWNFVKHNIRYTLDPIDFQFSKTPSVTWAHRFADCKCYSIFISSCLKNLGINHAYRFASYGDTPHWTHVYIIIKNPEFITIDCVMPGFDEQKPFAFKKDVNMTKIVRLEGVGQLTDLETDSFLFPDEESQVLNIGGNLVVDPVLTPDGESDVLGQIRRAGGKIDPARRRIDRRKLMIFAKAVNQPVKAEKLLKTGTAQTSRVLERVALKTEPITSETILRDKEGRDIRVTVAIGQNDTFPGELNIGDPAELTEGKFDLLLAKQRLEIEKELVEKIAGVGVLKAERFQDSIDTVDDLLEAMEIEDPEDREIELELIVEQAQRGEFSIAEEITGIGDIAGKKSRRRGRRKQRRKKRKSLAERRKAIRKSHPKTKKGRKAARKEIEAKGVKSKTGKFVKKVGRGLGKAAKGVTKVLTAPARLLVKGILEITLPKSAPFFLYLFINDPATLAKMPPTVRKKRKKAEKVANFIVNVIGMKRKHFMGIVRNGIIKQMGASPEKIIARSMKGKISGIGLIPVAALSAVLKIIKKLGKIFKKIFKRGDLPDIGDAPDPEKDFGEITETEKVSLANEVEAQDDDFGEDDNGAPTFERGGRGIFRTF